MKPYIHIAACLTAFILLASCLMRPETTPGGRKAALRPLPTTYPFIRYEDNVLQFPGGRTAFDSLYEKLDTLLQTGRGHVAILHIGGSHVQAGYLSHQLRTDFASLADSVMTERGLLFPFRILRTNAPQNYRIGHTGHWEGTRCIKPSGTDTLGIAGAAVSTRDRNASLSLSLNLRDSVPFFFTRLRLLGYATDSTALPYALHDGDTLWARHEPATRSYLIEYPASCDTADIRFLLPGGTRFTLTGILPENGRDGITYHATGINGADVPAWLRCAHLAQDLRLIRPDLAIFGIGINDANVPADRFDPEAFKANYRRLIALFKAVNPHCALLFVTNNDCLLNLGRRYGKRTNPNTARVAKAMKELASEYGGAVWDQYAIMGGSRSSALWKGKKLMRPDRIHFTAEGYRLVGDLLYNALITDYLETNGN